MATANPAMNPVVYQRAGLADSPSNVMTLPGAVLKTVILVVTLLIATVYTWSQAVEGVTGLAGG